MKCSQCGHESAVDAKFCPECGAKQELSCVKCGAALNQGARFCGECGTKVESNQAPATVSSSKVVSSITFSPLPLDLPSCKIDFKKSTAEGPDEDGHFRVSVNYTVTNNTNDDWEYLVVRSQIFNAAGLIIDESQDTYGSSVGSGASMDCEASFWGVNAKLLGDQPEKAHVAITIYACAVGVVDIGEISMPDAPTDVVQVKPVKLANEMQLVSASISRAEPDGDGDCWVELRALVQNLTDRAVPEGRVTATLLDKFGNEITEVVAADMIRPGSVEMLQSGCHAKEKQLKNSKVKLSMQAFRLAAAGLSQNQGMTVLACQIYSEQETEHVYKKIGYEISISAKLLVKFPGNRATPEDGYFYIRQINPHLDNIPGIFSVSLGRTPPSVDVLLAESWEDNLTFDYAKKVDGTWEVNVNGSMVIEPVHQYCGAIDSSEESYWADLLSAGVGELLSIEIEKRENGDASPDQMQIVDIEHGVITGVEVVYFDGEDGWSTDDDDDDSDSAFDGDMFFSQDFPIEAVDYSEEVEFFYDKLCDNYRLMDLSEGDKTSPFGSGGMWVECLLSEQNKTDVGDVVEKRFYNLNFQAELIRLCVVRVLDSDGDEQVLNVFTMDEWDSPDIDNRGHYEEFMSDMEPYDGGNPLEILKK